MDTKYLTRWQIRNLYFDAIFRLYKSFPEEHKTLFAKLGRRSLGKI